MYQNVKSTCGACIAFVFVHYSCFFVAVLQPSSISFAKTSYYHSNGNELRNLMRILMQIVPCTCTCSLP